MPDGDKASLLYALVNPGHAFAQVVDKLLLSSQKVRESTKDLVHLLPKKQTVPWCSRAQQPQTQWSAVPAGQGFPHHRGGQTQRGHRRQYHRPLYAQKSMTKPPATQITGDQAPRTSGCFPQYRSTAYSSSNGPPPFSGVVTTSVSNPQDALVMFQEVKTLLQRRAIQVIDPSDLESGFYSRYFLVPKRDSPFSTILSSIWS